MSIVDRLAEMRGGYTTNICTTSDCSGCREFVEKLKQTEAGRAALARRFPGEEVLDDPFANIENGGKRACVLENPSAVPCAVADALVIIENNRLGAWIGVIRDEDVRGKGYGRVSVQKLGHELKRLGVKEIKAQIEADNIPSQNLAGKLGALPDIDNYIDEKFVLTYRRKL